MMENPRRSRPKLRLVCAGMMGAWVAMLALPAPLQADGAHVQPGQVILMSQNFPSRLYDEYQGGVDPATNQHRGSGFTRLFVDTRNRLAFEEEMAQGADCPGQVPANFFEYDMDTYALRAQGCLRPQDVGALGAVAANGVPDVAVDSTDGLLLFIDGSMGGFQPGKGISAISEKDLSLVGSWAVPDQVQGLSWSATEDAVLAITNDPNLIVQNLPSPPVKLYEYNVLRALHGGGTLWNGTGETGLTIAPCQNALPVYWGVASAYRSDSTQAIFVPCQLRGGSPNETQGDLAPLDGVVKLQLAAGGSGCPASMLCPTGALSTAVSPAAGTDFFFDPISARGVIPCCVSEGSDLNITVYDGPHNTFLSTTNIGGLSTVNDSVFALDPQTGRFYAFTGDGLTQVDLRRTPIPLGNRTPGLPNPYGSYLATPVFPADDVVPFPRVVVPHTIVHNVQGQRYAEIDHFNIYADGVTVGQDPPPIQVDNGTYAGPVPGGGQLRIQAFSGNASGYGVHSDLVGGVRGAIGKWTLPTYTGEGLPFGNDRHDLMLAYSPSVNLNNGTTQARTIVAGPVDSGTASDYRNCTQLQTLYGTCSHPPCSTFTLGVLDCPTVPSSTPAPSPPATGQQWPYQAAECSQPGAASSKASAPGLWLTTGYSTPDANGNVHPQEVEVPGSEKVADASVDCSATRGQLSGVAIGDAKLDAVMGLQQSGMPTIRVGSASTSTSVSPPGPAGVTSSVTSEVDGVHLDLGGGAGLDVGRVFQQAQAHAGGRPGTATSANAVLVSNIVLTDQSGSRYGFCEDPNPCNGISLLAVLDQVNAHLPYFNLAVLRPAADDAFAKASGTPQSNGSPGGYESVVQDNVIQQLGDINYNEMVPSEGQMLPALRVVMYDDGQQGLTREIIDLAGVEADAEMSVALVAGDCTDCGGVDSGPLPLSGQPAVPPQTSWIAGRGGGGGRSGDGTAAPAAVQGTGLVALVEKILAGLQWLLRSPIAGIQMLLFLSVLLAAPVLMARRRAWLVDFEGDAS